jgi:chemotaxis protein methyltransferase CheR
MQNVGKPPMKPEDFRLFKEFVAARFGLLLEDGKRGILTTKLLPRLEELGLSTFAEYYSYLKLASGSIDEQLKFISLITNNETYFFREESQLRVFAEEVLPALKEKKLKNGDRTIRIVSAGCSSGEEVYSLAMLILESGSFAWNWDVKITGVDIDPKVIEKAEAGIYRGRAFQATPGHYRKRYFKECQGGHQVREVVRNITDFVQGNLLNLEKVLADSSVDIIFCRNVLIYFNDETVRRIVENFARFLVDDGLLFLGHSESLSRITDHYLPLRFPGAVVYRVRG